MRILGSDGRVWPFCVVLIFFTGVLFSGGTQADLRQKAAFEKSYSQKKYQYLKAVKKPNLSRREKLKLYHQLVGPSIQSAQDFSLKADRERVAMVKANIKSKKLWNAIQLKVRGQ